MVPGHPVPVLGMKNGGHEPGSEPPDLFDRVAEEGQQVLVGVDIPPLDQVVDVDQARGDGQQAPEDPGIPQEVRF